MFLSALALLPLAFLAGLVRGRFFRTVTVARLLDRLAQDANAPQVREALSEALGDPTLAIAYWLPDRGGYVDLAGRPLALPPSGNGRVATAIGHRGRRIGALIHDRSLCEAPELLRDATGAAALALENGRLEVELRAQLEALRASRARIVEAGDAERRRLTRDLHDGAQQRLVSLMIGLQVARQRWEADPAAARAAVDDAFGDARAAVEELRELAAGIHPAVLVTARPRRRTRVAVDACTAPGRVRGSARRAAPQRGRERRLLRGRRGARERRQARARNARDGERTPRGRGSRARGARGWRRRRDPRAAAASPGSRTASARSTGGSRSTARPAAARA